MEIGLVGEGPAGSSLRAQLTDTAITVTRGGPDRVAEQAWTVALPETTADQRRRLNQAACAAGARLLVIEPGRVAEGPELRASGLSGKGPCLACLRTRLSAAGETEGAEPDHAPSASTRRLVGAIVGHTLGTALSNESDSLIGQVWEWPYAERRVFPVPGCSACAGGLAPKGRWRPPQTVDAPETRSIDEAISRAEQAIDDRLGPVAELGEIASYPAPYYLAELAATDGFSDVQAASQAAGVATDWNVAFMKAVGEAIERYSAGVYRDAWFVTGRPREVSGAVSPTQFVRPDETTEIGDDPIHWVPAVDLITERDRLLPAETCVFPPPSRQIRPPITTGLGLGNSGMEAIHAGLREVVERDALMLSWYSTYEPLAVAVDDEGFHDLAARAGSEGLSVTPLLLTQDVDVPVIGVAVHRDGEWPRLAFGSAAHLDATVAARGALTEAIQNWMELRDLGRDRASDAGGWIGEYAALPDVVESFLEVDRQVAASDLGDSSPTTPGGAVDTLLAAVSAVGMTPYAAWLTPRDVRQLGFEAVRVVIPSAQPLFTDTEYFGERIERVPSKLGFTPRPDRAPHPFP